MTRRVLFYVQHLLGIGHLKRASTLVEAMAREDLDVTVAYGGRPTPEVSFGGIKVVQLPPAAIAGEDFSTLVDAEGRPVDAVWRAQRRDVLLALQRHIDPDVVLIELFPFGRQQFAFELVPLLETIHAEAARAQVACSVRDVLVATKKRGRNEETVATVQRFFDAVLVHGDPALIGFGATFVAADQIADRIRYTGYVATDGGPLQAPDGPGEVIVSAGGGAVGAALLFAAAAARAQTPLAGHVWRFLTGPNLPDSQFAQLAAMADTRTIVERFRPDFAALLKSASLSISQAGYNTTMDILTTGVRAVVVPYEAKGETEQRLRAEILASKGLFTVVAEAELSPARLAAAVGEALASARAHASVDLSGAVTTARLVHGLATQRV